MDIFKMFIFNVFLKSIYFFYYFFLMLLKNFFTIGFNYFLTFSLF